jgi:cbb3-type cytochrome oxidase subunit 3
MLNFHIIWTLIMLAIFIAIIGWAFSARRRDDFEAASRLPLDQDHNDKIPSPANPPEQP